MNAAAKKDDGLWDWARKIGVLCGAIIAVATIVGFVWNKATDPIVVALAAESRSRAAADSLLLQEIREVRNMVVNSSNDRRPR